MYLHLAKVKSVARCNLTLVQFELTDYRCIVCNATLEGFFSGSRIKQNSEIENMERYLAYYDPSITEIVNIGFSFAVVFLIFVDSRDFMNPLSCARIFSIYLLII